MAERVALDLGHLFLPFWIRHLRDIVWLASCEGADQRKHFGLTPNAESIPGVRGAVVVAANSRASREVWMKYHHRNDPQEGPG